MLVGVHETTVSRAVQNKYIQTPKGVYSMRSFFRQGFKCEDGTSLTPEVVTGLIAKIIDSEDKGNPYLDRQIHTILDEDHGLKVARRTITKYREEQNIPTSKGRKIRTTPEIAIKVSKYLLTKHPELFESNTDSSNHKRADGLSKRLYREGVVFQPNEVLNSLGQTDAIDTAVAIWQKHSEEGTTVPNYLLTHHRELFEGNLDPYDSSESKAKELSQRLYREGVVLQPDEVLNSDIQTRAIDATLTSWNLKQSNERKPTYTGICRGVIKEAGFTGRQIENKTKYLSGKFREDTVVRSCIDELRQGKITRYSITDPEGLKTRLKQLIHGAPYKPIDQEK